jgi:hypothetical protein
MTVVIDQSLGPWIKDVERTRFASRLVENPGLRIVPRSERYWQDGGSILYVCLRLKRCRVLSKCGDGSCSKAEKCLVDCPSRDVLHLSETRLGKVIG